MPPIIARIVGLSPNGTGYVCAKEDDTTIKGVFALSPTWEEDQWVTLVQANDSWTIVGLASSAPHALFAPGS